ncbi:hypothetical protein [Actinoallomurus sp. NPDC052274]|uniref:ATP-grasp domain-containing protein n=1 Tax=Actinoallomurus sp. NPDC052274 TaxID=3155420 RepID=UPI00341EA42D
MPDGVAAFFDQLSAPARVLDVRPRPVPCVLLLSRSCDADLDAVQGLLAGAGVRALRLNSDELSAAALVVDTDGGAACVRGRWIVPTVTWTRHFAVRAIEDGGDPAHRVFLQESWQAAAEQLAAISPTSIGPYGPGPLSQLRLARRHEVAVPRTMLTTDPSRARDAFTCRRLVVKAVHRHFVEAAPGRLSGIFPTIVERTALPGRPCPGPPVLVQEYVEHEAEWRVYYVAGQVHGFEVGKESPADPWTAADRVEIRSAEPPAAVLSATTRLAAAMSLRYGAFDFLLRDGVPVFLEANPDGDWRWAEERAGVTAVTTAVTRMLTGLHREAPAGSFDLLGFLARPTPAR